MKLFSLGGGKKRSLLPSPTERVIALSSHGLSEPEIIQTLRQEGYSPVQVDNGMREALRGAAMGAQPRPAQRYPPAQEYGPPVQEYTPPAPAGPARRPGPPRPYGPPAYEEFPEEQQQSPAYERPGPTPQPQPGQVPEPPMDFDDFRNANSELGFPEIPGREPPPRELAPQEHFPRPQSRMLPPEDDLDEEEEPELRSMPRFAARDRTRGEGRLEKRNMIEELTEGVVEEKWTDFRRRMDEMSMMFQQLSQRISSLEQKIGISHEEKNKDLLEVEGKIDNYKQTMDEIESRMESIERAMKDSLTPMMQTLRSLSDTLKVMKEKRA